MDQAKWIFVMGLLASTLASPLSGQQKKELTEILQKLSNELNQLQHEQATSGDEVSAKLPEENPIENQAEKSDAGQGVEGQTQHTDGSEVVDSVQVGSAEAVSETVGSSEVDDATVEQAEADNATVEPAKDDSVGVKQESGKEPNDGAALKAEEELLSALKHNNDSPTSASGEEDIFEELEKLAEEKRHVDLDTRGFWDRVKNHLTCGAIDDYCGIMKLRSCCEGFKCDNKWKGKCILEV